jgi:hypothetical protein
MSGPKLRIANQEYVIAELSLEARDKCKQIDFCDQRLAQLQMEIDVVRLARESAAAALVQMVQNSPVAETEKPKRTTRRKVH